ncbi:carotenoid oxygenase [Fusarium tricinctum]|uniref:Carotenoid oxygenase n=1 Tax=Fusarium tricinctum TaxID=61284 RepID=A0A8K0WG27_9HYPO|nr:carotenoid oxygenase [Fusarium tricinctum]
MATDGPSPPFPLPPPNPNYFGLKSEWPPAFGPSDIGHPGHIEGEMANLVVHGEIPEQIDGTFYRIMIDPFYPTAPMNPPVEGDGNVSAFRIKDGKVEMKIRYVDTERLKLERKANSRLFGLYRNPYSHHPCVRSAVDSTANTNLFWWGGHLLALKENALPYAMDPDTLETRGYDPFKAPGKTYSAHPKIDPFSEELVGYGYEAKGLGTTDIVVYSLSKAGEVLEEQWVNGPWCGPIHDCAITTNFIILFFWPYKVDVDGMKKGGQHWVWTEEHPATFMLIPRRKDKVPAGWQPGEHRIYQWSRPAFLIHAASAWEEAGKIYIETSRVYNNIFPMFGGFTPNADPSADFVRWALDPSQPTYGCVPDPEVILDLPSEFPRTDERLMGRRYTTIFLPVVVPEKEGNGLPLPLSLNGLAKVNNKTKEKEIFFPGQKCLVEEPIFIPRSSDSPEGDGWVIAMIQRVEERKSDLVVIDTRDFTSPMAIIELPLYVRNQIHGNWVDAKSRSGDIVKPLCRDLGDVQVSGRGALGPLS